MGARKKVAEKSGIKISKVLAYEEEKLIEMIESVPSSAYLIKPISPKALESAISQVRNDS
jgi:hypothetical protein